MSKDSVLRRVRGSRGFSLSELLISILIMTLAGIVVTGTVALAQRQFHARMLDSNAQLLGSTIAAFVQNELTCAGSIDGKYFCENARGLGDRCYIEADDNGYVQLKYQLNGSYQFIPAADKALYGPDGADMKASVSYTWDDVKNRYDVKVEVLDSKDAKLLTQINFKVKPFAPGV